MYLHIDGTKFGQDLMDFINGFAGGALGWDKHQQTAERLRDPKCARRKTAKVTVVANCVDCGLGVMRALNTIWERGSPVEFSLTDTTCPHCRGQGGFHYVSHHSLHA